MEINEQTVERAKRVLNFGLLAAAQAREERVPETTVVEMLKGVISELADPGSGLDPKKVVDAVMTLYAVAIIELEKEVFRGFTAGI